MIIPRTMSTQHPDNVLTPPFAIDPIIGLREEIAEALWAYNKMGIQEQMWDSEGKTALSGVVQELLNMDIDFFKKNPLGKKFFLTLRIPNPNIETNDKKLVSQVMMEIPRAYDIAKTFNKKYHGKVFPPIFEIILPMVTSVKQLNMVHSCYRDLISPKDKKIIKWLGEFMPKTINVIPLFEDMNSQLNSAKILRKFIADNCLEYVRAMLARSDPAINYGVFAAVLMINVSLQDFHILQNELGIPIYAIIGAGDGDRGNFNPLRVESILKGYPSCQTFTIQSAWKYDYPEDTVVAAVKRINESKRKEPIPVDKKRSVYLIKKTAAAYQGQILEISYLINEINRYVPPRRLRKKHVGLFGYPREVGKVQLPRAIGVCASLNSIGLPLRLFGLHALNKGDIKLAKEIYPSPNLEEDTQDSFQYFNPDALSLLTPKLRKQVLKSLEITDFKTHKEHKKITSEIIKCYKRQRIEPITGLIEEAARIRKFLG